MSVSKVLGLIKPADTVDRLPWEFYADQVIQLLGDLRLEEIWPLTVKTTVEFADIRPEQLRTDDCPLVPPELNFSRAENEVGWSALLELTSGVFAGLYWSCSGKATERHTVVSLTVARTEAEIRQHLASCPQVIEFIS